MHKMFKLQLFFQKYLYIFSLFRQPMSTAMQTGKPKSNELIWKIELWRKFISKCSLSQSEDRTTIATTTTVLWRKYSNQSNQ